MKRRFFLDTAERMVRTALQAGAAAWLVEQDFTINGLKVAGVAAVVALVTCVAAQPVGASDSASFLPENVDPPQGD